MIKDTHKTLEELLQEKPNIKKARIQKPKANYTVNQDKFSPIDFCNTPAIALEPLKSFITPTTCIWESAMGKGNLVTELISWGYIVIGSDIQTGRNFFDYAPKDFQVQITNPPYGIKRQWMQRSYELNKPFALLMPVEFLGTQGLHKLWRKYGQTQHIFFTQRINFDMPIKGLSDDTGWKSSAQFPTCWYCWGFNLPRDNMVYDLKDHNWWIE